MPAPPVARAALFALAASLTLSAHSPSTRAAQDAPAAQAEAEVPALSPEQARRLTSHTHLVTVAGLLLIGFLIVSYVLMRIGRTMMARRKVEATPYVDAWGAYRISEEEVDRIAPRDGPRQRPRTATNEAIDELEFVDDEDDDYGVDTDEDEDEDAPGPR